MRILALLAVALHRWGSVLSVGVLAGRNGMGAAAMRGLAELIFLFVGVAALLLSAALGAAAWLTALRVKMKSSGGVFARGFLGVSAVVAFLIGVVAIALSRGRWIRAHSSAAVADGLLLGAIGLGVLFLAVEFGIGGVLYWRVAGGTGRTWPKVLSVASFGLGALFGLAALLAFVLALVQAFGS